VAASATPSGTKPAAASATSSGTKPNATPSPSSSKLPPPPPGSCFYKGHSTFSAPSSPWNQRIDMAQLAPDSNSIINGWVSQGGFGGGKFQIDFSITVLEADASTPFLPFTPTDNFYVPDCDNVPMPVPACGRLEGETGYQCTTGGDCHLIVIHNPTQKLYEMWTADISGGVFTGGCVAVWDLNKVYPASLRGDQCTSADAGGFPISAMIFDADEIASGVISHAIRFILPNSRIASHVFVHPATHSTGPTSAPVGASPPYGARLRLKSTFNENLLPTQGARVIAQALKNYGMILSDGGTIALTASNDVYTVNKWANVGVDPFSLLAITAADFEVVAYDSAGYIPLTYDCIRNP